MYRSYANDFDAVKCCKEIHFVTYVYHVCDHLKKTEFWTFNIKHQIQSVIYRKM